MIGAASLSCIMDVVQDHFANAVCPADLVQQIPGQGRRRKRRMAALLVVQIEPLRTGVACDAPIDPDALVRTVTSRSAGDQHARAGCAQSLSSKADHVATRYGR